MRTGEDIRVLVDARFSPGSFGGVETFALGVARGLASIDLTGFQIKLAVAKGASQWARDIDHPRIGCVELPGSRGLGPWRRNTRVWAVRRNGSSFGTLPRHDRRLDRLGSDVAHLLFQHCGWTSVPFIYHPHDLQHRHLPQFFSRRDIARREVHYQSMCRRAHAVCVGTSWTKSDICRQFKVQPSKVAVVALAATQTCAPVEPSSVLRSYHLPSRYLVYPGASWPHKNHELLFAALADLRHSGLEVPLVLTGPRHGSVNLAERAGVYGLQELVTDLGYLPEGHLTTVTSGAVALVVPSLFESASFPIWEAFRLGVPVAASSVTALPAQVGDAGLIFDPRSVEQLKNAIATLWTDAEMRDQYIERGSARVRDFTWEKSAEEFLELYRAVASSSSREGVNNFSVEPRL